MLAMYYVLYNPLSSKGKINKYLKKLIKKIVKIKETYKVINILETTIEDLKKECVSTDALVFLGGDGTIHTLLNQVIQAKLEVRVFVYKAGSGNDFIRDHKGKFIEITKMIPSFPIIVYDDKEELFVNGVGTGIDAAVCNTHTGGKGYLLQAVRLFMKFKKFETTIELDNGQVLNFKDTWFLTVQHGRFFGGGMKLSPKSKRDDRILEVFVVHKVKLPILLMIFPLIFLGWHLVFKRVGIRVYKTSSISVKTAYPLLQRDGEVYEGAKEFKVFFKE